MLRLNSRRELQCFTHTTESVSVEATFFASISLMVSHSHSLRAVRRCNDATKMWKAFTARGKKENFEGSQLTTPPMGGTQKKAVHLIYKPSLPDENEFERGSGPLCVSIETQLVAGETFARTFKHWICLGFPCGTPKAGC